MGRGFLFLCGFMNGKRSWGKYAGAFYIKCGIFRVLWSLEHLPHGFLAQSQGEELIFYYKPGQVVGMALAHTLSINYF